MHARGQPTVEKLEIPNPDRLRGEATTTGDVVGGCSYPSLCECDDGTAHAMTPPSPLDRPRGRGRGLAVADDDTSAAHTTPRASTTARRPQLPAAAVTGPGRAPRRRGSQAAGRPSPPTSPPTRCTLLAPRQRPRRAHGTTSAAADAPPRHRARTPRSPSSPLRLGSPRTAWGPRQVTQSPAHADLTAFYISPAQPAPPPSPSRHHHRHTDTSSNRTKKRRRMYQAIPYSAASRAWPPRPRPAEAAAVVVDDTVAEEEERLAVAAAAARPEAASAAREEVRRAVADCPVLVVGRRGCCLSHVVKRLLQGLGVNPAVHEVAGEAELAGLVAGGDVALPAVFVGGRLLGGLDRLMAVHISGDLVPILKEAGALWL
ncbi:hypothetical protein BS78_09G235100 [Paspalum vaginatum]|nr:hypothetical protein BS78_09G235100 [Paspalum vaginatum]